MKMLISNKYPGTCACGGLVAAGAGVLVVGASRNRVRHPGCAGLRQATHDGDYRRSVADGTCARRSCGAWVPAGGGSESEGMVFCVGCEY